MNLRTRLLAAYGYLVVVMLAAAVAATLGFHAVGQGIGRVLDENVRSVRASIDMLETLERQDSAVLGVLLERAGAEDRLDLSGRAFAEAWRRIYVRWADVVAEGCIAGAELAKAEEKAEEAEEAEDDE